jgi:hypothetical protein
VTVEVVHRLEPIEVQEGDGHGGRRSVSSGHGGGQRRVGASPIVDPGERVVGRLVLEALLAVGPVGDRARQHLDRRVELSAERAGQLLGDPGIVEIRIGERLDLAVEEAQVHEHVVERRRGVGHLVGACRRQQLTGQVARTDPAHGIDQAAQGGADAAHRDEREREQPGGQQEHGGDVEVGRVRRPVGEVAGLRGESVGATLEHREQGLELGEAVGEGGDEQLDIDAVEERGRGLARERGVERVAEGPSGAQGGQVACGPGHVRVVARTEPSDRRGERRRGCAQGDPRPLRPGRVVEAGEPVVGEPDELVGGRRSGVGCSDELLGRAGQIPVAEGDDLIAQRRDLRLPVGFEQQLQALEGVELGPSGPGIDASREAIDALDLEGARGGRDRDQRRADGVEVPELLRIEVQHGERGRGVEAELAGADLHLHRGASEQEATAQVDELGDLLHAGAHERRLRRPSPALGHGGPAQRRQQHDGYEDQPGEPDPQPHSWSS